MTFRKIDTTLTTEQIAALVGGRIMGDPTRRVRGLCALEDPLDGHVCFLRTKSTRALLRALKGLVVAAALIPEELGQSGSSREPTQSTKVPASHISIEELGPNAPTLILVRDPAAALFSLVPHFFEARTEESEISPLAAVHPTAKVGKGVHIGAYAVIGPHVEVGDDAVIHAHAVLYQAARVGARSVLHSGVAIREHCEIGTDCILHNGTVIGADGFGFVPDGNKGLRKVPQLGNVRIGDSVEVGANVCIDRATLGTTVVDDGTKIDNLAQVGHNVKIGRSSIICGQVGIAGSARVGEGVVIGGQSGVRDHTTIAPGSRVAARSGVSNDLEAGDYAGYPAVPAHEWKRQNAALSRLSKMVTKLQAVVRARG